MDDDNRQSVHFRYEFRLSLYEHSVVSQFGVHTMVLRDDRQRVRRVAQAAAQYAHKYPLLEETLA